MTDSHYLQLHRPPDANQISCWNKIVAALAKVGRLIWPPEVKMHCNYVGSLNINYFS